MAGGDISLGSGTTGVRIVGLSKLVRGLKKAGADAQDLKDTMHAIGMIVVNAALPNVPRRTGRMAATLRAGKGSTKAVVRMGGKSAPYAGAIYYGWPAHNISPHTVLDQAREAHRADIVRQLESGISDVIKKTDLA